MLFGWWGEYHADTGMLPSYSEFHDLLQRRGVQIDHSSAVFEFIREACELTDKWSRILQRL